MTGNQTAQLDGVAAIFVVYLTSPQDVISRLEWMTASGGLIILIDNTPERTESIKDMKGVHHYCMGKNAGIAAALNRGLEISRQLHAKYIFTFDQDSRFDINLVDGMLAAYKERKELLPEPLALGPFPVNMMTGASYLRRSDRLKVLFHHRILRKSESRLLPVKELITSGLLADDATYAAVGLYNEDLFIDFVDHEWAWRLTKAGGRCFVVTKTKMAHMIGAGDIPFTAGMRLGSPTRIYYLFRNGLFLALTGGMPAYDAAKFLFLIPVKFLVFGMLTDRNKRWHNLITGIRAGIISACRGKIEQKKVF